MSKIFLFGYGFCARTLGHALASQGWAVQGSVRPGHERDGLLGFDRDHPLDPSVMDGVTHVLVSIPPDGGGDPALDWLVAHGKWPDLQWVGYLSTTGVYGDHGGDWVTEDSPLLAVAERAKRRMAVEQGWLQSGLPVQIFRLAGIYGKGRSALDSVRQNRAHRVNKPGLIFSRIHVQDVAGVLRASMHYPRAGGIYNVADDEPTPPAQVVEYACDLLRVPYPPEIPWQQADQTLSPMALSFYQDHKKVANQRIKQELGVVLRYPNYRCGLDALLQDAAR